MKKNKSVVRFFGFEKEFIIESKYFVLPVFTNDLIRFFKPLTKKNGIKCRLNYFTFLKFKFSGFEEDNKKIYEFDEIY